MIPDSRDLCLTSHLKIIFSSVQFSRSVVSNSLRPHESQHARPPCPSPTPRVHPDSRPSSQWCHLILCHPLLLLLSISPSIRVFSNESTLRMRWPKYWSTMNIYCSVAQSCPTLHSPMNCSTPGFPVVHHLPGACSNSCPLSWWCHLILCHPLLLLPPIPPSIRVFSKLLSP